MKVNGLPRQGAEEATMSDEYLIKNTTREKRERIVNEALGVTDGLCDGCAPGILKMYDAYIEGKMELAEVNAAFHAVNAAFHAGYVVEHEDERDMQGGSCIEEHI